MDIALKKPNECEVLIVDDGKEICELIKSDIKDICKVTECFSGEQALSLINNNDFDVIIADLLLPDIPGINILKEARKKDEYTELIIVTGHPSLETASEAISIGVSSYITKPISLVDLRLQLEKAIANRLFHLKSIKLMHDSEEKWPEVKNHFYDITSLLRFSRRLMLSLELPEVMKLVLNEINERTSAVFSVTGIHYRDINEIYAMNGNFSCSKEEIKKYIIDNWENAFNYLDVISFIKGEIPFIFYQGKGKETKKDKSIASTVFQLTMMGNHIGSLVVFSAKDFLPSQDETQFLHVFSSFVSSIVEHACSDTHAKMQARTDGLTGIANHRAFHESLAREIARSNRNGSTFSLLFMDIDDFKKINDTYGHLVGDGVIKDLVNRISEIIRRADTFARYGGEEFALILPDTGVEGATILARRICNKILEAPCIFAQKSIPYSISIGVSVYDGKKPKLKDILIDEADKAMYKSKISGKGRITISS